MQGVHLLMYFSLTPLKHTLLLVFAERLTSLAQRLILPWIPLNTLLICVELLKNFKYIRFNWIWGISVNFFHLSLLLSGLTFPACQLTWAVLSQLLFSVTSDLLTASFWRCTSSTKSLMEIDFAVGEISNTLTVAFWRSLTMCISADGQIVITELLCRHEEPVVWAWSHTAIHLSLHSSNKCHLYTDATHVSLLADIIDACFSGDTCWLIATANVLRVRRNNKSWWWLSDTELPGPLEKMKNYFHWCRIPVYQTYHKDNI